MKNKCKDCKYWYPIKDKVYDTVNHGECGKLNDDKCDDVGCAYGEEFTTHENFGCINWEMRS